MKKSIFTLVLFLAAAVGFSQDFEIPASFDPKGPAKSFANYNEDFFKAHDWLVNNAPNAAKRKQVNAFVIGWLTGTPDVTLEINLATLNFMDDNPQYMPIFMAGWAKYALENKDDNAIKGTVAGINSTLAFYEKYKTELGKSKALDAYAKSREKGKLEEDVKKKLKS